MTAGSGHGVELELNDWSAERAAIARALAAPTDQRIAQAALSAA